MHGMIHVYCGNGKGKTTCALGLGVRACGSGLRVLMIQFLKGDTGSELSAVEKLPGFQVLPGPHSIKFTFQMTEQERSAAAALCAQNFFHAVELANSGACDLLILDEACGAVSTGMLCEKDLLAFLKNKPEALEVVLTGRDPSPELCALADYISEIQKVKHPYDRGVSARRGIDY